MEFLRILEGLRTPILDAIFGYITMLGEETVVMILLCVMFWCVNKRTAYTIGAAFILSGLAVQGMKICFRIERPWIIDPTFAPVPSAVGQATGYSFPSGHTQTAAAIYGSIGARTRQKQLKIICFIVVGLVAFSRLYLGVHTPLDVSVSLLLTFLLIYLTIKILHDTAAPTDKIREIIFALFALLCSAALIVIASTLYSNGAIALPYLSDSLKAAGAGAGFAIGIYIERNYIKFSINTKNIYWQVIKFVLGIAGVLAIKEGLKPIIGTAPVADTIRYFIMIIWFTAIYPLIIKRFFADPKCDNM